MNCPKCGASTRVLETRGQATPPLNRRVRVCAAGGGDTAKHCGYRFATIEQPIGTTARFRLVLTKNGIWSLTGDKP